MLGQQSVMQEGCHRNPEGPARQRPSYVAEGHTGSPWAAQLGSLCCTSRRGRRGGLTPALNHWPRESRTEGERAGGERAEIYNCTIPLSFEN